MHLSLIITILVGVAMISESCKTVHNEEACSHIKDTGTFQVTLHRGACLGQCPTYIATIHGSGRVDFRGIDNVPEIGNITFLLSPSQVCTIARLARDADFFNLPASIMQPVADFPRTAVTVSDGEQVHTVEWNFGEPAELKKLAMTMDSLVIQTLKKSK